MGLLAGHAAENFFLRSMARESPVISPELEQRAPIVNLLGRAIRSDEISLALKSRPDVRDATITSPLDGGSEGPPQVRVEALGDATNSIDYVETLRLHLLDALGVNLSREQILVSSQGHDGR